MLEHNTPGRTERRPFAAAIASVIAVAFTAVVLVTVVAFVEHQITQARDQLHAQSVALHFNKLAQRNLADRVAELEQADRVAELEQESTHG